MHKEASPRRAMSPSRGIDRVGLLAGRFLLRAMSRKDMDFICDKFVSTARLCGEAGFDAVEIHMGHGYLLSQFISPFFNKRRDAYGGSAENRVRFPAEVLRAIKDAVGAKMAVLAKINLFDGLKSGATVQDAVVTASALEAAGVDMLILSGGRSIEAPWVIFGSPLPDDLMRNGSLIQKIQFKMLNAIAPKSLKFSELYFLDAARQVRGAVSCALAYLGGVLSLDAAKQVLDEGFDAVAMARALVHDPALISRFRADPSHRSGCDSCNRCVVVMYGPSGTYCTKTGNEIPAELNRIYTGSAIPQPDHRPS